MKSFPKQRRFESEEYKDFIRKLPCCVCDGRRKIDPHHLKSQGAGGSDLTCIPLCRYHHTEVHLSRVKLEDKYHIGLKDVLINCMQKFIEEQIS